MKPSYFLRVAAGVLAAGIFSALGFAQVNTPPESTGAATPNAREPAKVDLNTADIPTLEAVPEIGTDHANAVVAGRPYKSVDDFARVMKMAPEKMATLRAKVWVSPPKVAASATTTPRADGPSKPSKPPRANEGKATAAQDVTERYDRAQSKKPEEKKN